MADRVNPVPDGLGDGRMSTRLINGGGQSRQRLLHPLANPSAPRQRTLWSRFCSFLHTVNIRIKAGFAYCEKFSTPPFWLGLASLVTFALLLYCMLNWKESFGFLNANFSTSKLVKDSLYPPKCDGVQRKFSGPLTPISPLINRVSFSIFAGPQPYNIDDGTLRLMEIEKSIDAIVSADFHRTHPPFSKDYGLSFLPANQKAEVPEHACLMAIHNVYTSSKLEEADRKLNFTTSPVFEMNEESANLPNPFEMPEDEKMKFLNYYSMNGGKQYNALIWKTDTLKSIDSAALSARRTSLLYLFDVDDGNSLSPLLIAYKLRWWSAPVTLQTAVVLVTRTYGPLDPKWNNELLWFCLSIEHGLIESTSSYPDCYDIFAQKNHL